MIGSARALAIGLAVSATAHGTLVAALALMVAPETVTPQPLPLSKLDVAAYRLDREPAPERPVGGELVSPAARAATRLGQGAIPTSRAAALAARSVPAQAAPAVAEVAYDAPPTGVRIGAALPAAQAETAISVSPAVPEAAAVAARRVIAVPGQPRFRPAPRVAATSDRTTAVAVVSAPAAAAIVTAPLAPAATQPQERSQAVLAWSGAGGAVDPLSLAAIEALMRPGDLAGDTDPLRDGVAALLDRLPCSRVQAAFLPETGVLELRGHIPEDGLRAPVLAALQARLGPDTPVTDNLLILPRPQCGALAGLSAVGLPQSTDQLTDARLIGADAHARLYRYSEGDRLALDLTAPDYPSHVYVDYFDAAGRVIHLVPNDTVALQRVAPKAALAVGSDRDGVAALDLRVGPPFGQEIAAAIASSRPLYDGVRPMVEPAAPYLKWLRDTVAAARRDDPDFKGEWVYFFIATAPRRD